MADAPALGAGVLDVGVQVPSSAPQCNLCGSGSVVERYLAKVDVASSNLVFRSTKTQLVCVLYIEKTAYINKQHGRLAQLVEQLTLNQWVRGSSPRSSTKSPRNFGYGAFVMIDSAV